MNYKLAPKITFHNGLSVPILGIGTWQSQPGEVYKAICTALDVGVRLIDGAQIYMNEKEVGRAIKDKIEQGSVARGDIFVTSKVWNTCHSRDLVKQACANTLKDLQLDYLDLYLMHFPMGFKEGGPYLPYDENKKMQFSDVDYLETWSAMEQLQDEGLVKSIGVSNFNRSQLERLLSVCRIQPVTNQVECHPHLPQKKLLEWCRLRDIVITGYSPLGSPGNPFVRPGEKYEGVMDEKAVQRIAKKYGKTPAQVLIRYQMDRGIIVIPKSVKDERIRENFDVLDFFLTHKEIEELTALARADGGRVCKYPTWTDHKYYPFHDE